MLPPPPAPQRAQEVHGHRVPGLNTTVQILHELHCDSVDVVWGERVTPVTFNVHLAICLNKSAPTAAPAA